MCWLGGHRPTSPRTFIQIRTRMNVHAVDWCYSAVPRPTLMKVGATASTHHLAAEAGMAAMKVRPSHPTSSRASLLTTGSQWPRRHMPPGHLRRHLCFGGDGSILLTALRSSQQTLLPVNCNHVVAVAFLCVASKLFERRPVVTLRMPEP